MKKYKCEICNKNHNFYFGSKAALPIFVLDILRNDENDRVEKINENFFVIDNKTVIIEGDILTWTQFQDNPIVHTTWLELSLDEYNSQMHEQTTLEKDEIEITGKLASILPFYPNFVGLNVKYINNQIEKTGEIKILTKSKLKYDTENPISIERMIEMMKYINHPELNQEKKVFNKPFKERLIEAVENSKTKFSNNDKSFLIDISNFKEVLFQLISSEKLDVESKGKICLYLSNDSTNENYSKVKNKMEAFCANNSFEKIILDEIETYQKHYQFTDDKLTNEVISMCVSVFDENIEELEITIDKL